jgi:2'-5' RNA ligase
MTASDANGNANQRLFFALWPEPGLQRTLADQAAQALGERRAKRLPAENLHITLAFLGEVDAATRACAEAAAGRLAAEPFTLSLDRLGYWPRKGLLWAGPTDQPPALEALAADLNATLAADCGHQPDNRPFRAHVTLARKVPKMPGRIAIDPLEWPVTRFVLVASELGKGGARYTIVGEWPLTAESNNGSETET